MVVEGLRGAGDKVVIVQCQRIVLGACIDEGDAGGGGDGGKR